MSLTSSSLLCEHIRRNMSVLTWRLLHILLDLQFYQCQNPSQKGCEDSFLLHPEDNQEIPFHPIQQGKLFQQVGTDPFLKCERKWHSSVKETILALEIISWNENCPFCEIAPFEESLKDTMTDITYNLIHRYSYFVKGILSHTKWSAKNGKHTG